MKKKLFLLGVAAVLAGAVHARHTSAADGREQRLTAYRYAGPFAVREPVMLDSVNVESRHFDRDALLAIDVPADALKKGTVRHDLSLPKSREGQALHLAGFCLTSMGYATATLKVEGVKDYVLTVDGVRRYSGDLVLEPASHEVVVKYLTTPDSNDSLLVSVKSDKEGVLTINQEGNGGRLYTLTDVMQCWRYMGVSVSPDGRYLIVTKSTMLPGGRTTRATELREVASGRVVGQRAGMHWMPRSNRYYYTRPTTDGSQSLVAADPATGVETVLAERLPAGSFVMSPTEDYVVLTVQDEGPKERKDVYEVVEPDDRQPGWRSRSRLELFDLQTGVRQPLTYGYHNATLSDISTDGRYLLVMKTESRLTARPTTVSSLYRIDRQSFAVDTLVIQDGFVNSACFSPDGSEVLLTGSPEALGGIGKNVRDGQTPSMTDIQLFVMDVRTKAVRAMTRDFDPSVSMCQWNSHDALVYFTAEDKDCVHLFRLYPKTGRIQRIEVPEEMVMSFSMASASPTAAFYGQGAMNSDRLYTLNTKSLRPKLHEDLSAETLKNVELGTCTAWTYLNDEGDTICCRYYLPPHFDASRRYPMIVNYYGGCSPTSRNFESRYPQHAYAAQGYVVLIVNPRGATGFGQKFSAHHVNTAGEGVAEDIIGAVKQFCAEHKWVNEKKIGCIGASYGGFMTQYLQTKTDLFAAAISHAGISDHTSYWGEGYWGYSYSEVSMANSYPWTDRHLYVDQSPLFNADKIHTPLLFLHGTSDTNVPVGESIQMYTALKLLGRPTAMVLVDEQNHHILDYQKRIQWQNTIFAWFARYLKDDPTWWNSMYKKKAL